MATFPGTPGPDNYTGSALGDLISGGVGNDTLNGGGGSDTVNGGADSDVVSGGGGGDSLIWRLSENIGVIDSYFGGDGTDTVRFEFSAAEWNDPLVRQQVVSHADHVAAGGAATPFALTLAGNTLNLSQIEKSLVVVDGVAIANLRAPGFSVGDVAGAVVEDTAGTLKDVGTFQFYDVDVAQSHTVTSTKLSAPLGGALKVKLLDPAAGDGQGTIEWTYTIGNGKTQVLAEGETAVEKFNVTVKDSTGLKFVKEVDVSVTGKNDKPLLGVSSGDGAVSEDSAAPDLTASGTIVFTDVDRADVHGVSVTKDAGNAVGGTLQALIGDASTGDGVGLVGWTYTVANSAVQFLDAGQTAIEKFTILLDDGHGGKVSKLVAVTVHGTDTDAGATVITGVAGDTTLQEDEAAPLLATAGTIGMAEAAQLGGHSVAYSAVDPHGAFDVQITDDTDGDGIGELSWFYGISNDAVQSLGAGDSLTDTFTVTVTDSLGGTVSDDVVITVLGTNDLPTTHDVVIATNSGEQVFFQLLASDVDTDDTVGFGLGTAPLHGSVAIAADGSYELVANAGYVGTDAFTFSVTDSAGGVTTGQASVLVGDGTTSKTLNGGVGRDDLVGSSSNDTINGGAGSDMIDSRAGSDTIVTGADGDVVLFVAGPGAGIDTITDFTPGLDWMVLYNTPGAFDALPSYDLAPDALDVVGDAQAPGAATRVIYDPSTGALSYDADGTGAGAAQQFAVLQNLPVLTVADFWVGP